MAAVGIRAYESVDYDACRALWVELTEHHRELYDAPSIGGDDPGSGLDQYLGDPKRVGSWVAVEDGTVVGLAGLQTFGYGEIEVEPIIVGRTARGRGIGRLLMERLFSECRERGYKVLSIMSVARNSDALASWKSMGFGTVGRVELFVELDKLSAEWRPGVVIDGVSFDC
jgi:GNAT superfamily N-acetyltransferase